MKRPQPDIGDILKASFLNNMGSVRKFKRLWGTTTVNGVEVLNRRQYYYPESSRSENFEKLFKFLGIYKDVTSSNPSGVSSAWVYLNKNKETSLPGVDETEVANNYKDFIAHNLNQMWWNPSDGTMPTGLTLTTNIVIEAETASRYDEVFVSSSLLNPSWPKSMLIANIQNNYDTLWDSCLISQQGVGVINKGSIEDSVNNITVPDEDDLSPNDPWMATLARYALKTTGVTAAVKDVSIGLGRAENGRLYTTYITTVEIPYIEFTTNSSIVQEIADDLFSTYPLYSALRLAYTNGYYTRQAIQGMDSSDLDDDPDYVTRVYRLLEDETTERNVDLSSIWYRYGLVYYIRADVFDNPRSYNLTYKQLYSYISRIIDSGYAKKRGNLFQRVIAVAVFVVAVVLAPVTGGYSLSATNFALSIVYASVVLTLFTLAFTALGLEDWAGAFGAVSRAIDPLVTIASLFLLINNLSQLLQKSLEQGLQEALKEQITNFVEKIMQGVTDLMSGSLTNTALDFMTKVIKLITIPQQLQLARLSDRNKDLQAEYENLVDEMYRENDMLLQYMRTYARPATADWSIYAEQFDFPYERGGGTLAMGNIQRTTKQALRKADYSDSAFDNILVV